MIDTEVGGGEGCCRTHHTPYHINNKATQSPIADEPFLPPSIKLILFSAYFIFPFNRHSPSQTTTPANYSP